MWKSLLFKVLLLTVFFASFYFALPQLSQVSAAGCAPGPDGFDLSQCFTLGRSDRLVADVYATPTSLLNVLVRNAFLLGGVIVMFMIIYSGWIFITNESKGADEARQVMTAAVGGLVLMFAAYWIVQIIEVLTGLTLLAPTL